MLDRVDYKWRPTSFGGGGLKKGNIFEYYPKLTQ